jgi:hypothetical protein
MQAEGERRYSSYSFKTSALDKERTHVTHWAGDWVGPRAGMDTEVIGKILLLLPAIEP